MSPSCVGAAVLRHRRRRRGIGLVVLAAARAPVFVLLRADQVRGAVLGRLAPSREALSTPASIVDFADRASRRCRWWCGSRRIHPRLVGPAPASSARWPHRLRRRRSAGRRSPSANAGVTALVLLRLLFPCAPSSRPASFAWRERRPGASPRSTAGPCQARLDRIAGGFDARRQAPRRHRRRAPRPSAGGPGFPSAPPARAGGASSPHAVETLAPPPWPRNLVHPGLPRQNIRNRSAPGHPAATDGPHTRNRPESASDTVMTECHYRKGELVAEQLFATLHTNVGAIRLELFPNHAPKTVATSSGSPRAPRSTPTRAPAQPGSGPVLQRRDLPPRDRGFMIQGGDPTGTGTGGPGYKFNDEIHPELHFNRPYLLAMANAGTASAGHQRLAVLHHASARRRTSTASTRSSVRSPTTTRGRSSTRSPRRRRRQMDRPRQDIVIERVASSGSQRAR